MGFISQGLAYFGLGPKEQPPSSTPARVHPLGGEARPSPRGTSSSAGDAVKRAASSKKGSKAWLKAQLELAENRNQTLVDAVKSLTPAGETAQDSIAAAVEGAREAKANAGSAGSAAVGPEQSKNSDVASQETEWSIEMWLDSLGGLVLALGETMKAPLVENGLSLPGDSNEAAELAFIRAIGDKGHDEGTAAMLKLLQHSGLLARMAEELYLAARELAVAKAATVGEMQSKFHDEAAFTMNYGGMETFYGGLEKLLGPPSPNLREAMRRDHCASADSLIFFTTPNYDVHTTSQIEWMFVTDPVEGLAKLKMPAWPVENSLLKQHAEYMAKKSVAERERLKSQRLSAAGGGEGVAPAPAPSDAAGAPGIAREASTSSIASTEDDDDPAIRMRDPLSIHYFEAHWANIDNLLEALDIDTLQEVEFFGARLYTGPLYVKYNAVLRGIDSNPFMERRWNELCHGNRYCTTLHVINSAVVKLAKLQPAVKVYRGVVGGRLPDEFLAPNEHNVCGGCEYGFLSTTTDVNVAAQYASSGKVGIVFEMAMGMVDRGANLSWLSQYPHEAEILFAPLTGLEVKSSRVTGQLLMVEVRLSVNLTNKPIEEVVAKMQSSALGLVELMREDFRHHGAPQAALEPLESFYLLVDNNIPEFYNISDNYQDAVREALDAKRKVLHLLTNDKIWMTEVRDNNVNGKAGGGGGGAPSASPALKLVSSKSAASMHEKLSQVDGEAKALAKRQHACAAMAAREGQAEDAAMLLRLTVTTVVPGSESHIQEAMASEPAKLATSQYGSDDVERWRLDAAYLLLSEGCMEPWPATFVLIADTGGHVVRQACAVMAVKLLGLSTRNVEDTAIVWSEEEEAWRRGEITQIRLADGTEITEAAAEEDADAAPLEEISRISRRGRSSQRRPSREEGGEDVESFLVKIGNEEVRAASSRVLVSSISSIGLILHEAAASGSAELVTALLQLGVGIYESNAAADTPLHAAARSGRYDVCKVLFDAGSDPFLDNAQQQSPYEAAVHSQSNRVRRLFKPEESDMDVQAARLYLSDGMTDAAKAFRMGFRDGSGVFQVSGAGVAECNGLYVRDGDYSGAPLFKKGRMWLLRYPVQPDVLFWYIADKDQLNADKGDYYRVESNAPLPPTDGWSLAVDGVAPSPKLQGFADLASAPAAEDSVTLLKAALNEEVDEKDRNEGYATSLIEKVIDAAAGDAERLVFATAGESGVTALMLAALNGYATICRKLIEMGASVDAQSQNGASALLMAAENGHDDVVELLCTVGKATPTLATAKGKTILHNSARYGHVGCVEILIRHGADVQRETQDGRTSLFLAAQSGHNEVCKLLLEVFDSDANEGGGHAKRTEFVQQVSSSKKSNGRTALMEAAMYGHTETCQTLLDAGADPAKKDADDETALTLACADGHSRAVRVLIDSKRADVNMPGFNGRTPLMAACHYGHHSLARELVTLGAKVDLVDKTGSNAIMNVCLYEQEDDFELLDILIKAGAVVDKTRTSDSSTALHIAAEAPHDDATTFLLKAGANPNLRRKDGHTPLTLATANGFESVASLLIDSGVGIVADVNMANTTEGNTPLHYAAQKAHLSLLRRLLGDGAKADVKNKAGDTPLDLAEKGGTLIHMQIASKLREVMRGGRASTKRARQGGRRGSNAMSSIVGLEARSSQGLIGGSPGRGSAVSFSMLHQKTQPLGLRSPGP